MLVIRVATGAVLVSLCACGGNGSPPVVGSAAADGGRVHDASSDAAPVESSCEAPTEFRKGMQWVRNNPMFISGLIPGLHAPDQSGADDYYDVFGANAVHLWENGLPTRIDDWSALDIEDFRWVSWVRYDGTSWDGGEVLGGYTANPKGRIGYQVGDEPREWDEYEEMAAGISTIRTVDPDGLHYMNFSHYADDIVEFLDDYGTNEVGDIISYDIYGDDWKTHRRMAYFREAGMKYGIPNWCYIRFYGTGDDPKFWGETDLRWSVFLHVLNGCVGFSYFFYQIDAGSEMSPAGFAERGDYGAEKRGDYFIAAAINRELAHLGRVITQLRSVDVRYVSSFATPPGVKDWAPGAGRDSYLSAISASGSNNELSIGFFEDDRCETYVMIQNANHPSGTFPTGSERSTTVTLELDFAEVSSDVDTTSIEVFDKKTGVVESVALEDLGGGRARFELELPAGELLFYKYSTDQSFAMQETTAGE